MFKLLLNRWKQPGSLENVLQVRVFTSSLWMLAAQDLFTLSSKAGEQRQLLAGKLGKLGERIKSGGHGERGRAGLKRKARQGQKNPLWRKKI